MSCLSTLSKIYISLIRSNENMKPHITKSIR